MKPDDIDATDLSTTASFSMSHLHSLIAHYLSQNYPAALDSFLAASRATVPSSPPNPDLQTLVTDAQTALLSAKLSATTLAPTQQANLLSTPLPPLKLSLTETLSDVSTANLLAVRSALIPNRSFTNGTYVTTYIQCLAVGGADKVLRLLSPSGEVLEHIDLPSPILSIDIHPLNTRYAAVGTMDGTAHIVDFVSGKSIQQLKSDKFVVRVQFNKEGYLATASYDHTVRVYAGIDAVPQRTGDDDEDIWIDALDDTDDIRAAGEPNLRFTLVQKVETDGNPEALAFVEGWLVFSVRGGHELSYLGLPETYSTTQPSSLNKWLLKRKSLNPQGDAHVSFAVLDLAVHPSGKIIAGITGDHAHGGERVLLYGAGVDETERLGVLWTGNESDAYVLPRVRFTPDGKGVITTSCKGEITVMSLKGEVGCRLLVHAAVEGMSGTSGVIRDIDVREGEGEGLWQVVSVGYDRTVRVCTATEEVMR